MQQPKRYRVSGWIGHTARPKETDGTEHIIGEFDLLRDAEAVRRARLAAGWGHIEIRDSVTGQVVPFIHWFAPG